MFDTFVLIDPEAFFTRSPKRFFIGSFIALLLIFLTLWLNCELRCSSAKYNDAARLSLLIIKAINAPKNGHQCFLQ